MENTIYKETIPSTDKRLNRHVHHDERSKQYAIDTAGMTIVDVTHQRFVPIFDQGQVGSCTGNAGIGSISTDPFINASNNVYTRDEAGALKLYSDAEALDGNIGYPQEDKGSSGLTIAKVLKTKGLISGYQHTFTLHDALLAGSKYAFITGTNWYENMFYPDADGRVHPTGKLAGGHEYELSQIDVENGRIWFFNSWGDSWGVKGRFYLTWADYNTLLSQQGDVTVLIPATAPSPTPVPAAKKNIMTVTRQPSGSKETLGSFVAVNKDGQTLSEKTLELPWLNNQANISCIPKGIYQCSIRPFYDTTQYQILDVPGRSGIFIHVGNYYTDILGCIIIGIGTGDINHDGQIDVTSSVAAITALKKHFNNEDFTLIIQ